MKVISPGAYNKIVKRRHRVRKIKAAAFLVVVGAAVLGGLWWTNKDDTSVSQTPKTSETAENKTVESKPKAIGNFTGEEFKELYNTFSYPNTDQLTEPPYITGDPDADARIREIAEERGYKLRSYARDTMGVADENPLQITAQKPWQDLKAQAEADDIILTATWGFRTIEDQRQLFVDALYGLNAYPFDIANGLKDAEINEVLEMIAPPGYSRHHTGFTVDLTCGVDGLTDFENTECYEWLAYNNYERMKKLGWVPSYPKGATLQGPEPEPWEYIWVGVEALYK